MHNPGAPRSALASASTAVTRPRANFRDRCPGSCGRLCRYWWFGRHLRPVVFRRFLRTRRMAPPGRMHHDHRRPVRRPHDRWYNNNFWIRRQQHHWWPCRRRNALRRRPWLWRQSTLGTTRARHVCGRRRTRPWSTCPRRRNCWPARAKAGSRDRCARRANFLSASLRSLLGTLLQTAGGTGEIAIGVARQEGFVRRERIQRHGCIPSQHFQPPIEDRTHLRSEACSGIQCDEFLITVYRIFLNYDVVGCAFRLSL